MVKTTKWIKSILIGGKKDKEKIQHSSKNPQAVINESPIVITPATTKEKKRWSFRRSSAKSPDDEQKKPPPLNLAEVSMTAEEEEDATNDKAGLIQEMAAIKIQSVFRSYLARKALRALRGLVKLQALVRGRLVRKRATATLKCMEALITAQARARAQRIRSSEERKMYNNHRQSNYRDSFNEVEKRMMEDNIKIVEMDIGQSKYNSKTRNNNHSYYHNNGRRDDRFSTHYASDSKYMNQDYKKFSPAPSAITDTSPRTCSGHYEDYSESESLPYDCPLYPSYMANTQSSRAKARSQSAPKQRPESFERQPSRRRPSLEGRNIPRAVRMQRSSSNVGAAARNYHYPWSIKLDKSSVSLIDSECGSTCSVLTTSNYCRSGVPLPYDNQGRRY